MANNAPAGATPLPKRDQDSFKALVKAYEQKNYKKAIKLADGILRSNPQHGETLAMKGLTLNAVEGRKDEALPLVRAGLRNNIRSFVCWHVAGLVYRSDRQYKQAIKCYRNALRFESANQQILRDLSLLQVHLRDMEGFCDTRMQLLTAKANQRTNWLALAVGHHMQGDHARAVNVIDTFLNNERTCNNGEDPPVSYEQSELLLFRNDLLVEQGKLEEALAHLAEVDAQLVDRHGLVEKRGRLLLQLGRFDEARALYRELLERNPDNWNTHLGLQAAVLGRDCGAPGAGGDRRVRLPSQAPADAAERQALAALYAELREAFPRCNAVRRIPISLWPADAPEFRAAVAEYMQERLRKGVPSLFADLASDLYGSRDPDALAANARVAVVGELAQGFVDALEGTGKFPGAAADAEPEPPTSLLWALYFCVQHHDRLGDVPAALRLLDRCQAHTPTAVDLLQRRARLLKHGGDAQAAADVMDAARQLDLADRYSNNKATKYLLRADRREQAEETIAMFTKHDGDPLQCLYDLQVIWFELEHGESSLRLGDHGLALKRFLAVEQHFNDFREDLFDFHSYSIRKTTLRAYVAALRGTETVFAHAQFNRAAKGAIETYLQVAAQREAEAAAAAAAETSEEAMTPAERKRAKAAARKKAKRAEEEAKRLEEEERKEEEARLQEARRRGRPGRAVKIDSDRRGRKLLEADPIAEADRLSRVMQANSPDHVWTWLCTYDVARRRGKWLQAMRAIVRARRCDPDHPAGFVRAVQFLHDAEQPDLDLPATVAAVLRAETHALLEDRSLRQFIDEFYATHHGSMPHRLAAARAVKIAVPARAADGAQWAVVLTGRGVSLANCVEAHKALEAEGLGTDEQAAAFRAECAARFPLSTYFNGEGAAERAGATSAGEEAVGSIQ